MVANGRMVQLSIFGAVGLLAGCGEPEAPPTQSPPTVSIRYGNPSSDPQRCGCSGSRPVFLVNRGNAAQQVSWWEYRRDRISGQQYTPQQGTAVIEPTGTGEGRFTGCTIDAPATSCRFDVRYGNLSRSSFMDLPRSLTQALGNRAVASAANCQAICSDPDSGSTGACLPLGFRYYEAVAPIRVLFDEAIATGARVRKDEVMNRLGLQPGSDQCERGDVENVQGVLTNEGPNYCRIRSRDLPPATLRAAGVAVAAGRQSGMSLVLPPRAVYRVSAPARTVGILGESQADDTAPFIQFDGAGADKLNRRYGGPVQSLSRITIAGRPAQTILQTSNGCIAVDEALR